MMVAPWFWRQLDESQSTETETLTILRDKTNERPTFTRAAASGWLPVWRAAWMIQSCSTAYWNFRLLTA